MLFDKAFSALDPDQRKAFGAWRKRAQAHRVPDEPSNDGRKVVAKLSIEEQLGRDGSPEEEVFKNFLIQLSSTRGRRDVDAEYEQICEDFVRKGPGISGRPPKVVERFVPAITFLEGFEKATGIHIFSSSDGPEQAIEHFLRRWENNPAKTREKLKKVRLAPGKREVVFLTFNVPNSDRNDPSKVFRRIGIEPPPEDQRALFDLKVPVAEIAEKKYPTVCDAGWNRWFKPSKSGDPFGETLDLNQRPPGKGVPEFVTENRAADCVRDIELIR